MLLKSHLFALTRQYFVVIPMTAMTLLSSCGVKFMNEGFIEDVTNLEVPAIPGPSYVQITDISPTSNDPLSLSYGPIAGPYHSYCILENDTNAANCAWTVGSLPTIFSTATTEGNVVLSVWIKDVDDVKSIRVDSNVVQVDRVAPTVASFTVTNATPTSNTSYALTYGAISGNYTHYCILENNTNPASCTWAAGAPAAAYTVTTTNNAKILSLWLRDAANNLSIRQDSNSVTLDTVAPTITLQSLTGGQVISGGANTTITWTGSDLNPGATPITIEVSSNSGGTWTNLASNEANDGSYTWAVPSVFSTTYRVRLRFTDAAGNSATSASSSDFTINNSTPVVTVTSPNGGEVWRGGSVHDITWTSSGLPSAGAGSTAEIEYSLNNGGAWTSLVAGDPNDGTYSWTLPAATNSQQVLVRVKVTDNLAVVTSDVSDSNFAIDTTAPTVTLTSLTGGQVIQGGTNQNITWTATDTNPGNNTVLLEVSSNSGGAWSTIASGEANDGSYTWAVPSVTSSTYRVRVTYSDAAGNSNASASTSDFTVNNTTPVVTVTSPNGGEFIRGGVATNITWTATGLPPGASTAAFDYSVDAGATWTPIATAQPNNGTYSWSVPSVDDPDVRVRVTVTDFFSVQTSDISNANFTVDSTPPVVTLTSPLGGEIYAGGSTQTITWTATDTNFGAAPISIYVSTDGGSTYPLVAGSEANDGSYTWTVPMIDSSTVHVRVHAADRANNQSHSSSASITIDSTAPDVASVTVTNTSPTNSTTYGLTYGAVTGTYSSYCILKNDTTVGNCSWTNGTLPASYTVDTTNEAKVLSVWIRDTAGNVSTRRDSNSVTFDNVVPTMASATVLNNTPTPSRGYLMQYTTVSETVGSYCILENDTTVGNCSWTVGTLPDSYTVTATQNSKILSVWIRDSAGNQSVRYDTNSVTYTNVLTISPTNASITAGLLVENMEGVRSGEVTLMLNNGKILVAGGCITGNTIPSYYTVARLYDPTTGRWSSAGHMSRPRCFAAYTKLADGKVFVAGGMIADNTSTTSAEIYDPVANSWSSTYPMNSSRGYAQGTLLPNGNVLVSGGYSNTISSANAFASTEIYNPTTKVWLTGPVMGVKRFQHKAIALSNGNVMLIGGRNNSGASAQASTDIFTPSGHNGTIAAGPSLNTARAQFGIVSLTAAESPAAVDSILVIGGYNGNTTYLNSVELYNGTNWTTKTAITGTRRAPGVVKLADGTVSVMGGYNGSYLQTTGNYDPKGSSGSGTWTAKANHPLDYVADLNPILQANGRVFTIFGENGGGVVNIYNPSNNSWDYNSGFELIPHFGQTPGFYQSTADGKVLTCGWRSNLVAESPRCLLYDSAKASAITTAPMPLGRMRQMAATAELTDGRIIVVGGQDNGYSNTLNTAEIYNPTTDSWTATTTLPQHWFLAQGVTISATRVIFPGGAAGSSYNNASVTNKTLIYNPSNDTWSTPASADLPIATYRSRAVKTPSGRIFLYGGADTSNNPLANLYEWNNGTTSWTSLTSSGTARSLPGVVYIPGGTAGKLFVMGGTINTSNGSTGTTEIYDIGTNTWSGAAPLPSSHTNTNNCLGYIEATGDVFFIGNWTGTAPQSWLFRYNIAGNSWTTPVQAYTSGEGYNDFQAGKTCGVLPDGRFWNGGNGYSNFQVIHNATPVRYTANQGDGNYTFSITSGTGFLDQSNKFIPATPLVPSSSSTIRVDDGSGQNASTTNSVP